MRIVAIDTVKFRQDDAVIFREPGQDDEIVIRTAVLNPASVHRAIRQLEFLRRVEGDVPKRAAMYRVTLDETRSRDAQLKRTTAGQHQLDLEMKMAETISDALARAPANSQRHMHPGVGDGPFLTVRVVRP